MAKLALNNLQNVNTVLSMLYDKDGNYRAGFQPDEFYNTILLDTLKYGEENFVHLKYAENLTIRKGFKTAKFRRWAGLTPTLRPLLEGVPSAPDKHAYETLEIGNVWSFGRWSEYTDAVNMSQVDELIAERSIQYGELANQIKELYARKVWLSSPNEFFANFKASVADLAFGDAVTLDDLRFLVARMKRMQVKPIGGKFNYICSPEFINGLIDDSRVKEYMTYEQTTGKLFGSGEPFDLFELHFIPTLLDEFAYPDTEFPGVYELANGEEVIRYYHKLNDTMYYLDVHQDMASSGHLTVKYNTNEKYLPDGTAIDNGLEKWDISSTTITGHVVGTGEPTSKQAVLRKSTIGYDASKAKVTYGPLTDAAEDITTVSGLEELFKKEQMQLPIHRGILFGDEAMVKLNVEGVSDAPRMIVKPVGSSGVMDPLDQRQSVGFRVDGFGLAIKRPEAVVITYGIPVNAEFGALTNDYYEGNPTLMDAGFTGESTNINDTNVDGEEIMNVDGVNGKRVFVKFSTTVNYSEGDVVEYKDKFYKFTKGHKGAWTGSDVVEINANINE